MKVGCSGLAYLPSVLSITSSSKVSWLNKKFTHRSFSNNPCYHKIKCSSDQAHIGDLDVRDLHFRMYSESFIIEDFPRCVDGKSKEICDNERTACFKFSTKCTPENIEYNGEFDGEIGWEKGRVEVNFTGIPPRNDFMSIGLGEGGE